MDQQYWESEEDDGAADLGVDAETQVHTDTFYVAMKLALARLKEYSAAATG